MHVKVILELKSFEGLRSGWTSEEERVRLVVKVVGDPSGNNSPTTTCNPGMLPVALEPESNPQCLYGA